LAERIVFQTTLGELAEVPGSPYAYWAPQSLRELFQKYPPLDRDVAEMPNKPKIADVKQGLATADDLRFTRFWWEVPVAEIGTSREETYQGKKWVPFAKGGRPFYHDIQLVVNWESDGAEIKNFERAVVRNESFYFRPGLAWARMEVSSSIDTSIVPTGCVFSHAGGGGQIFPLNSSVLLTLCASLNSRLKYAAFKCMNPLSHGKEAGVIARIPVFHLDSPITQILSSCAREAYDLLREWDTGNETSTQFIAPWILQVWRGFDPAQRPVTGHPLAKDFAWSDWPSAKTVRGEETGAWRGPVSLAALAEEAIRREGILRRRLEEIQRQIDDEVYRLYGISEDDRRLIEAELTEEAAAGEAEDTAEQAEEDAEAPAVAEAATLSVREHTRRLLHYLAHRAIAADPDGIVPLADLWLPDGRKESGLAARVREKLAGEFGVENLTAIEEEIATILGKPLERWLAEDLFACHLTLYRLRPIIWQLSSYAFAPRRGRRSEPAFSCFVYWHRLDRDTLYKVQHFYLRPLLTVTEREVERLAGEVARAQSEAVRVRRRREEEYQAALDRREELSTFDAALSRLLAPQSSLRVESRSEWVKERVKELVVNGYRPERGWGVRVNIEPLKQAGVLAREAARVKG
jgi:hypothetical protein